MYGKAIELFLVNGSADSLTTAELQTGMVKLLRFQEQRLQDVTGMISKVSACTS